MALTGFTLNSSSSGGRQADITLPATVSSGDLLVAMHYDVNNETIPSTPAGWTLIHSFTGGTTAGTLGIIAKIADGTEGGTNLSWFPGSDNNYAALALTPDETITSLGSVSNQDGVSNNTAGGLSLSMAVSTNGTPPMVAISAGGSNGNVNVSPEAEFVAEFFGADGVELGVDFYAVGDSRVDYNVTTGDTGRQTLVIGLLNLNVPASVDVDVTGVGAAGEVDDGSSITGDSTVSPDGLGASGDVDAVSLNISSSVDATGVEALGQVGIIPTVVEVTGVGASGLAGDAEGTGNATATPFEATNAWNEGAWGDLSWGGGKTSPDAGEGQVGSVTVEVTLNVDVDVTGVEATGQVGNVFLLQNGLEATGEVGTALAQAGATVSVTGLEATGATNEVVVTGTADVSLTGLEATGEVGTATATADVTTDVTGVQGSGGVGTVDVIQDQTVDLTGVEATGEVGDIGLNIPVSVNVTGRGATTAVGSVTVQIDAPVDVTGVAANGEVGFVTVWGKIIPDPGTTYSEIDPSQSPGWGTIDPSGAGSYSAVSPNPGTIWTEIEPVEDASWEEVA